MAFLAVFVLFGAGVGWTTGMVHIERGELGMGFGLLAGSIIPATIGCLFTWLECKYGD